MDPSPSPSVVIVDDHAGFRRIARLILTAGGFAVLGEAADGAAGLQAVRGLSPAVVLLDVNLPDRDGFSVATELLAEPAPPAVVLVSTQDAEDLTARVRTCGARGFVPKHELSAAAVQALLATPSAPRTARAGSSS